MDLGGRARGLDALAIRARYGGASGEDKGGSIQEASGADFHPPDFEVANAFVRPHSAAGQSPALVARLLPPATRHCATIKTRTSTGAQTPSSAKSAPPGLKRPRRRKSWRWKHGTDVLPCCVSMTRTPIPRRTRIIGMGGGIIRESDPSGGSTIATLCIAVKMSCFFLVHQYPLTH